MVQTRWKQGKIKGKEKKEEEDDDRSLTGSYGTHLPRETVLWINKYLHMRINEGQKENKAS